MKRKNISALKTNNIKAIYYLLLKLGLVLLKLQIYKRSKNTKTNINMLIKYLCSMLFKYV